MEGESRRLAGRLSPPRGRIPRARRIGDTGATAAACSEALYRVVVSGSWVDYHHGLQYLPYELDGADYTSSQILKRRFPTSSWAQLVDADSQPDSSVWQDEFGRYKLSAPYPADHP